MALTSEQKKLICMAMVFTPLLVAIGITIAPFLFVNEMWQSLNDNINELRQIYANDDMAAPEHLIATPYNDFLMIGITQAIKQMPGLLVMCYVVVAIPIAVFSALYSFIYRKNNSIILMVIIWAAAAACLSFVLNQFFFTDTLSTKDHFIGRIIAITLIFAMTFAALIIGILMRKSLRKSAE
ncbi:hypothetical protein N5853_04850 [Bartonella sp. HY329]|uniref:hypothetical protein n=1 Tax=unclassified Bartonella TaxID=2645622 RepID=UPI0021C8AEC1|nr:MULTISPECIES: hypothetical protein [unclassified Bartonella]UXM95954.1 hypothetical protein N5853_04850 [Bartonella sp. HY329]UXN10279.1 hypothetical protein N5852_04860 [Bartonella sp. HY328]